MSLVEVEKTPRPVMGVSRQTPEQTEQKSRVIVLGNEKGGSGKSTTAMHITIALLKMGQTVGAIDLDSRQKSFSRYIHNRRRWAEKHNPELPIPVLRPVERSMAESRNQAEAEERENFLKALNELKGSCDYVVIDSPGSDTFLSRLGHAAADTIITPINDSYVDLDLLADIDPETNEVVGPSLYSEMVWDSRKKRALSDRVSIDWILMRNRLSSLDAKNKRKIADVLQKLSPRTGFRIAPGFGERVIYRELFPLGLTLLDVGEEGSQIAMSMSHVAARQELRDLMVTLKLPGLEQAAASF